MNHSHNWGLAYDIVLDRGTPNEEKVLMPKFDQKTTKVTMTAGTANFIRSDHVHTRGPVAEKRIADLTHAIPYHAFRTILWIVFAVVAFISHLEWVVVVYAVLFLIEGAVATHSSRSLRALLNGRQP